MLYHVKLSYVFTSDLIKILILLLWFKVEPIISYGVLFSGWQTINKLKSILELMFESLISIQIVIIYLRPIEIVVTLTNFGKENHSKPVLNRI